jgi:hypothetical protein
VSRQTKANKPPQPTCPKCRSKGRLQVAPLLGTTLCGSCIGAYHRAEMAYVWGAIPSSIHTALEGVTPSTGRKVLEFLRKLRTMGVIL